jgi:hypothetical protein
MPSEYIAPLSLKLIFVDTFAGSPEIFTGIVFMALCIGAGLFRMPNIVFMMMIVLVSHLEQ